MFNAKFSRSHKHKLRRNERRLADAGSLSLQKIESRTDRLEVLDEIFRTKKNGLPKEALRTFLPMKTRATFSRPWCKRPTATPA